VLPFLESRLELLQATDGLREIDAPRSGADGTAPFSWRLSEKCGSETPPCPQTGRHGSPAAPNHSISPGIRRS